MFSRTSAPKKANGGYSDFCITCVLSELKERSRGITKVFVFGWTFDTITTKYCQITKSGTVFTPAAILCIANMRKTDRFGVNGNTHPVCDYVCKPQFGMMV